MGMRMILTGLIILSLLTIIAAPTLLLLGFGLLPTLVAFIVDRTDEKSATFCVGGLNFSGVFPYLMGLWGGDNSLGQAMDLITDVFALAVMFGSAGMGWMIFLSLPPVVASFIQVMSQRRLDQLRKTQRDILAEWGDEVISDADLGGSGLMPPSQGAEAPAQAAEQSLAETK